MMVDKKPTFRVPVRFDLGTACSTEEYIWYILLQYLTTQRTVPIHHSSTGAASIESLKLVSTGTLRHFFTIQ